MLRTLLFLLDYFKLGIIGFFIVVSILYTIYSNRIYSYDDTNSTSVSQVYQTHTTIC